MCFRRHYIRQQGLHAPVVASSAAFFAYSSLVPRLWERLRATLTVRNSHTASSEPAMPCRGPGNGLRVGPFSSSIQLSLLPRWPRLAKTTKLGRSYDAGQFSSACQLRGGRLHRDSWTIQAPPPCNRPPPFFGA